MSKNKNRRRDADTANQYAGRITDKPKRTEFTGPAEIRISGPKHFFREDDSVHIFEVRFGGYRNSIPLTTEELRIARDKITEWLADDYGPRPTAG